MSHFITGTDTGVGKTYITALLVRTLRAAGISAAGYKPVSCGDRDDAQALAEASGGLDLDLVNPLHLRSPLAPYSASLLELRELDPAVLIHNYQLLAASHDVVLVEGVGGWEVPLTATYRVSDLARDLALPVIVVAANRLGALNHILLTVDAIHHQGLSCSGVILNQLVDELDISMISNQGVVAPLAGVPLLEHLIHGQDFISSELLAMLAPSSAMNQ